MTVFQILHCADLHLDASFASSGLTAAAGAWRRADLRATLGRILTLARERQVDAVTIAGGLYEQDYALPDTAAFLVQQFAKLAPIRVFIAPGERDPYTNDSLYTLTRWPENVTVFSQGRLSAVELAPGIHLWGAACPPARGHKVLDKFHADRDGVNLLLLHATDAEQPAPGREALFSVDAVAMRAAGFDFALLGHQHKERLWPEDAPCCVYPGSPEPLAPEEADGAHQVVLLTIQDGACTSELITVSQWRYLSLRVDLTGVFVTSRAVIPMLRRHGGGRIVNIASVAGLVPLRLQSAFVAAKAGVINLTRSMALELGPENILVNCVAPGSTLTAGTRALFYGKNGTYSERAAGLLSHIPLGRPASTAEIAHAVLFLLAPEASYINGAVLPVDGGWTAGYIRDF